MGEQAQASRSHTHFTRSKTTADFKSAGILPFSFHYGDCFVLLGSEDTRTGPGGKLMRPMCGCRVSG